MTVTDRGSRNQDLLAAFGRALSQEAHLLVSRPELTWQQLHNRLQWVTAVERKAGLAIRCPACWHEHALERDRLGSLMTCPTPACGLALRVNPFEIGMVPEARRSR